MTADLAVEVRGLTYAYPGRPPALDDVSFTIARGERIGLVGPNGAGKTSLFLVLCGINRPWSGCVRVAGLDVGDAAQRRRLPGEVGLVFQDPDDQLFNATVFDDVAFGPLNQGLPPDEVRARVALALEQVGLSGLEDRLPLHLSGGEKRRAALAGVLAMRPNVLLLDEPSMFLDARGRRTLIQLLGPLSGTQVIASHDLEMVLQVCNRVLLLDSGRLVASGDAREILADGALLEAHGLEAPPSLRRVGA